MSHLQHLQSHTARSVHLCVQAAQAHRAPVHSKVLRQQARKWRIFHSERVCFFPLNWLLNFSCLTAQNILTRPFSFSLSLSLSMYISARDNFHFKRNYLKKRSIVCANGQLNGLTRSALGGSVPIVVSWSGEPLLRGARSFGVSTAVTTVNGLDRLCKMNFDRRYFVGQF